MPRRASTALSSSTFRPAGWHTGATRGNGSLILIPDLPDDACEFCHICIATGEARIDTPATWLAANARRFVDDDDSDTPEVEPVSPPEAFNVNGRPGAMMAQKVDGDIRILFAVRLFGRMEMIGFEMPASDEAELAAQMAVFERDVTPMIEGARFASEGAQPLMPPPQPGNREAGDGVTLSCADGRGKVRSLRDGGLEKDGTGIRPVELLADGTRIDGSVSTFFHSGFTPGSGVTGGVSASSLTTFHPDGTWTRDASGGGFATSSEDSQGGRYEVRDGLLTQFNRDGTVHAGTLAFRADGEVWVGTMPLDQGGQCVQAPLRSVAKFSP